MSTLYLKITEECNMRCPFCYIKQKPGVISLDAITSFCNKKHLNRIVFHGGEPLLYPKRILEIIDKFPNKEYSITSNLTLPLTEERLEVLHKCNVATSYSVDRFHDANNFLQFVNNLYTVAEFTEITILITLSREQLKESPEKLATMLRKLPHKYILLERLYEEQYDKKFAQQTDLYMKKMMQLLPIKENSLILNMLCAIKNHINVFSISCNKTVFTLGPDNIISNCPNLCNKKSQRKKRKECIECDLYEYCKGDCLSFQNGCMFPKETFKWVYKNKEKLINDII